MADEQNETSAAQAGGASQGGSAGPLRAVVAAVAALTIAFCGWAALEYAGGRDPLAFITGSAALQTTVEAGQDDAAADDASATAQDATKEQPDKQSADKSTTSDDADGEVAASEKAATTDGTSADKASDQDGADGQSASEEVVTTQVVEQVVDSSSQEAASSSGEAVQTVSQPAQPQTIVVTLTVDGGAGSSSAQIELSPGSTALDALTSAGVGVEMINNPFGSGHWVTSIGGLAEESGHGWTYRVNGSMPNVMSDLYEVHDGDAVLWQYV